MTEQLFREGKNVGFKLSGDITKADYSIFVPVISEIVDQEGSVNLLLDITDLKMEEPGAWGADLRFGKEYHDKIAKLAMVGDKAWEKWLTKLCTPFYAKDAKYFSANEQDEARAWVEA